MSTGRSFSFDSGYSTSQPTMVTCLSRPFEDFKKYELTIDYPKMGVGYVGGFSKLNRLLWCMTAIFAGDIDQMAKKATKLT